MRGISACPSRNSLALICGLRLPTYRMLVTTISSQSRQELPLPTQKAPLQKTSNRFHRPFINRIHRPSHSPQKTHLLGRPENNIDWKLSSITTVLALIIIYINISNFEIPFLILPLFIILFASIYIDFPSIFSIIQKTIKSIPINIDTPTQFINFLLPPLLTYYTIETAPNGIKIPHTAHLLIILLTLIPLLPILVYTFHKFHKPENRLTNPPLFNEEKTRPQIPFEKLKSATQLVPIIISISFAFILIQNIVLMNFDLGLAIHLTATEFTNTKYEWISFMLILIFIAYSTFLPSLAISILYEGFSLIRKSHHFESLKSYLVHFAEQRAQAPKNISPITLQQIISPILTFLHHVITLNIIVAIETTFIFILGFKASPSTLLYILVFSAIAYLNVNIYMLSRKSANPAKVRKILYQSCLKILMSSAIIISIIFHDSAIISFIKNSVSLGATISSPSRITSDSAETSFSCVFLNKQNSPESIAFGIIVSSKDSSIHIFSPIRNEDTGEYAEKREDGILYPNKLVETHIKVTEGYHIEKFDKSKHWFNPKRGSCNYRNEPPFYEYQQVKSKLIIRNIS